jgi:hypothetical protein
LGDSASASLGCTAWAPSGSSLVAPLLASCSSRQANLGLAQPSRAFARPSISTTASSQATAFTRLLAPPKLKLMGTGMGSGRLAAACSPQPASRTARTHMLLIVQL